MKSFFTILLLSTFLFSQEKAPITTLQTKQKVLIGAGPYVQSQPYDGADALLLPTPVIFFDNKLFYVRWTRVGLYFMGHSGDDFSWGASLNAQPRPFGYKAEDSTVLAGMDERKNSWEAGLSLAAEYKTVFAELLVLHDILDASNGYMVRAELGNSFKYEKWGFYPSFLAIYRSDKFNDYYYGVTQEESTPTRPFYRADGGMDYAAQTFIKYNFTNSWSTLINLRADLLSQEASNSPIVSSSQMYSGMVSLIYTFEY